MHLQADVFAGAERSAHAAEHQPDRLRLETQTISDLLAIFVQPLGGNVQLDSPTTGVRYSERRLEPEKRLVLHSEFVGALDDHVTHQRLVAADDALVTEHVAIGMNRRERTVDRTLRIGERSKHLVLDLDGCKRATACVGVVGSNCGDRLSDEANDLSREHWLVGRNQPIGERAWNIVGGNDRRHPGNGPGSRHINADDTGVWMRRPECGAPEESVGGQIARELELTLDLRDSVRTENALAQTATDTRDGRRAHAWLLRATDTL